MGVFGVIGYYAYHWEIRSEQLLALKRAQLAERRQKMMEESAESAPA